MIYSNLSCVSSRLLLSVFQDTEKHLFCKDEANMFHDGIHLTMNLLELVEEFQPGADGVKLLTSTVRGTQQVSACEIDDLSMKSLVHVLDTFHGQLSIMISCPMHRAGNDPLQGVFLSSLSYKNLTEAIIRAAAVVLAVKCMLQRMPLTVNCEALSTACRCITGLVQSWAEKRSSCNFLLESLVSRL